MFQVYTFYSRLSSFLRDFFISVCYYFDVAQFIGNTIFSVFILKFKIFCTQIAKKLEYFDFEYVSQYQIHS